MPRGGRSGARRASELESGARRASELERTFQPRREGVRSSRRRGVIRSGRQKKTAQRPDSHARAACAGPGLTVHPARAWAAKGRGSNSALNQVDRAPAAGRARQFATALPRRPPRAPSAQGGPAGDCSDCRPEPRPGLSGPGRRDPTTRSEITANPTTRPLRVVGTGCEFRRGRQARGSYKPETRSRPIDG